jgi:iron-sulfur cluster repair protein YtfE (RIC family)
MLEQLDQFNENTVVHIHKEDKVLFPGALEAQRALNGG